MSAPVETNEDKRKALKSSYWANGPGPAGVMLPPLVGFLEHDKTKPQRPAYSLGLKLPSVLIGSGLSPGPIYSIPVGMTAKGPHGSPAYSLRMRTKVIENFGTISPGPAAYYPPININRTKPPEFSLASRHRLIERGYASPGPIYLLPPAIGPVVPDKPAAPAASLKSRAATKDEAKRSPGPIYDIGSPDLIKPKAGEVTIKGLRKALKSQTHNAGLYDISNCKVWRQSPSFSLGIRHSQFAGTLLTECDKLPY